MGIDRSAARELIARLGLAPHPEGGWFRELYRSATLVETSRGARAALTTILYLLERGQYSRWHVVGADEAWHYYAGEPLELVTYEPSRREAAVRRLGGDAACEWVAVVPAGAWQAARPLGEFALVGCTVAPGFEFEDFRFVGALPEAASHFASHPGLAELRDLL